MDSNPYGPTKVVLVTALDEVYRNNDLHSQYKHQQWSFSLSKSCKSYMALHTFHPSSIFNLILFFLPLSGYR